MPWISRLPFTLFSKLHSEFSEGPMRSRRATFFAAILFAAIPGVAAAQSSGQYSGGQPSTLDQVVDRIVAQEKAEMQMLHQYSPLVETYIQLMRPDQTLGTAPAASAEDPLRIFRRSRRGGSSPFCVIRPHKAARLCGMQSDVHCRSWQCTIMRGYPPAPVPCASARQRATTSCPHAPHGALSRV